MHKKSVLVFICVLVFGIARAQSDLEWSATSPAGMMELQIPSFGSLMQGFMYKANGPQHHPTLVLLHGYPGNERNLDLAQAVRAHGWNVIYFNYRGSWGSQGEFSFRHCVEDVASVVAYCKANASRLQVDTAHIALFGHSMGGFVCLQALASIRGIRKGFAVSAWDIYREAHSRDEAGLAALEKEADSYFVLNKRSGKELFAAVIQDPGFHSLEAKANALSDKQLVMLDEHNHNAALADVFGKANHNYFNYEVWPTDHPFTNKRQSLIRSVIAFLDK